MKGKMVSWIFWLCSITDIVANTFNFVVLHWIAKPLLMPCLVFLFIRQTNRSVQKNKVLVIAGLFFGWLGDVLLLFESRHPLFFILGLAGFLCGHLFYIVYFSSTGSALVKVPARSLLFLFPVSAYVAGLLHLLYPALGELKIPVTAYAIVLAAMLCMALRQYYTMDLKAARFFIAGASSFVVSDSLLAINKFYHPFSLAAFLIMLSYCAAQYLIVRGAIQVCQKKMVDGAAL